MKAILFATLAASLALAGAAAAQPVPSPATDPVAISASTQAVGHWLYDPQGNVIGSVRALAEDGRNAAVVLGAYFQPGSHEVIVPARRLSAVDGKVTLRTETAAAMNAPAS